MKGLGSPSLGNYNIFAFSTATLNDILCKFSEPNFVKVAVTYVIMVSFKICLFLVEVIFLTKDKK